jgi:glycosyltransferase involved in cell wall biosynthesis
MGAGRPVLYYDTPENREVAGGAGQSFRLDGEPTLEGTLIEILEDGERLNEMGRNARQRVEERYLWSDVTDAYERLLEGMC